MLVDYHSVVLLLSLSIVDILIVLSFDSDQDGYYQEENIGYLWMCVSYIVPCF